MAFSPFCFIFQGEISNDQDVVEYIMNQPNVVPRINSRILTADREYLDLTATSKGQFLTLSDSERCIKENHKAFKKG